MRARLILVCIATAPMVFSGSMFSAAAMPAAQAQRPSAFAMCAACHKITANEASPAGPNLWKVGGRRAGATAFNYSPAMKGSKIVWTRATLTKFIMAPREVMPGTRMAYAGTRDPKAAAAIADYLMGLR